jgi:hypothetical protein
MSPYYRSFKYELSGDHKGAYLGVTLSSVTEQLGDYFGVDNGAGALVTEVDQDSPAAEANIRAGDIIVSVNGQETTGPSDVQRAVSGLKAGEKAEIDLVRNKSRESMSVVLSEREFDPAGDFLFGQQIPRSGLWDFFRTPRGRSGQNKWLWLHDDSDEPQLEEQMDEFRKELEKLRHELNELKDD